MKAKYRGHMNTGPLDLQSVALRLTQDGACCLSKVKHLEREASAWENLRRWGRWSRTKGTSGSRTSSWSFLLLPFGPGTLTNRTIRQTSRPPGVRGSTKKGTSGSRTRPWSFLLLPFSHGTLTNRKMGQTSSTCTGSVTTIYLLPASLKLNHLKVK